MTLHSPFLISPRLMPALQIGGAWVQIEPTGRTGDYGKGVWRITLDLPDGTFYLSEDLQGHGGLQEMFETCLSFLGAAAEAWQYGPDSDNYDMFPPAIMEWAAQESDEIGMLQCEIEETKNLIH